MVPYSRLTHPTYIFKNLPRSSIASCDDSLLNSSKSDSLIHQVTNSGENPAIKLNHRCMRWRLVVRLVGSFSLDDSYSKSLSYLINSYIFFQRCFIQSRKTYKSNFSFEFKAVVGARHCRALTIS